MMNRKQALVIDLVPGFLLFHLALLLFHSTTNAAQEVENEREFEYMVGAEKGPEHWGDIHKEWEACKNGKMQSPIDMSNQRVEHVRKSGDLRRNYKPANATLLNRGHDISVKWVGDAGSISINGTEYLLRQCHWHSPSEHSIRGIRYDLEMHLVHESSDPRAQKKFVVVGQLYKSGQPDDFLTKLNRNISSMARQEGGKTIDVVDPREIKTRDRTFYVYVGSLTSPPCTEGVLWILNGQISTVSKEQVALMREAVHDYAASNARPLQRNDNQKIYFFDPIPQTTPD